MAKFMKDDGLSHKVGRPVDTHKMENFEKLCDWFENYGDCELYTLSGVWEIVKSMSNSEVYEPKVLKRKLKEHYGKHVYFTELQGRVDVICFREMASYIIYKMKKKRGNSR